MPQKKRKFISQRPKRYWAKKAKANSHPVTEGSSNRLTEFQTKSSDENEDSEDTNYFGLGESRTDEEDDTATLDVVTGSVQTLDIIKNQADGTFWELPWLNFIYQGPSQKGICDTEVQDSDGFWAHMFYVVLDKVYQYDPSIDLDDFVTAKIQQTLYKKLKTECKQLDLEDINFVQLSTSGILRFVQLYDGTDPRVKLCVSVGSDVKPFVMVHGRQLNSSHPLWSGTSRDLSNYVCGKIEFFSPYWGGISDKLSSSTKIYGMLSEVNRYDVCIGNPEEEYQNLLNKREQDGDQQLPAYKESDLNARTGACFYSSTIRSKDCSLLVKGLRCRACSRLKYVLRGRWYRLQKKVDPNTVDWRYSRKSLSSMNEAEKIANIQQLKKINLTLETKLEKLQGQLLNLNETMKLQDNGACPVYESEIKEEKDTNKCLNLGTDEPVTDCCSSLEEQTESKMVQQESVPSLQGQTFSTHVNEERMYISTYGDQQFVVVKTEMEERSYVDPNE